METSDSNAVALSALAAGSVARLHETRLDEDCVGLLRALGLLATSDLRLCKAGEPCIVQVGMTRIGVSRDVASRILVIPNSPASG